MCSSAWTSFEVPSPPGSADPVPSGDRIDRLPTVDRDIEEELALGAAHLADVDVEEADRVALEAPFRRPLARVLGQAGDAVALQQPVQAGTGEARDRGLQGEQHIVERLQGLLAEGDDRRLLERRQDRRSGSDGPGRAARSAAVAAATAAPSLIRQRVSSHLTEQYTQPTHFENGPSGTQNRASSSRRDRHGASPP